MFWELMILWPQYQKSQKCSGNREHFYKTQNPQLFEQPKILEGIFLNTLFKKMRTKARFFYCPLGKWNKISLRQKISAPEKHGVFINATSFSSKIWKKASFVGKTPVFFWAEIFGGRDIVILLSASTIQTFIHTYMHAQ